MSRPEVIARQLAVRAAYLQWAREQIEAGADGPAPADAPKNTSYNLHVPELEASGQALDDFTARAFAMTAGAVFHQPGKHDQRSHGKRGLKTPDAPPQVATPSGELADHVAKWHRDLDDLGTLMTAIDSGYGPNDWTDLAGGAGSRRVYRINYKNGAVGVTKSYHEDSPGISGQADAEQLASALGRAIGAPVPRVVRTQTDEIVMEWVEGFQAQAHFDDAQIKATESDGGVRLGLVDLLTANIDRHEMNWLIDKGTPVGIDHGHAYMSQPRIMTGEAGPGRGSPFAQKHFADFGQLKDNPMTAADVDWVRARLDDLRDDYQALGRDDWWQYSSEMLDNLAAHATGAENRFAPKEPALFSQTFHLPGKHDQRSHGKKGLPVPKAPTPIGSPTGARADELAKWHRDLDDVADLVTALDSGVVSSNQLGGGQMATTHREVTGSGVVGVRKKLEDVDAVLGPGTPPRRQADAEQLASIFGRAIGIPVPRVVRTGEDEVFMDHIDGETGKEMHVDIAADAIVTAMGRGVTDADAYKVGEATWLATVAGLATRPDGIRMGLFDLLTNNWDRGNETNWMINDDGELTGIDHSFAFSWDILGEQPDKPPPHLDEISPFSLTFIMNTPAGIDWNANPLTKADVAWVRERLNDARDDFEVLEQGEWWQKMSERLDAIEQNAMGGINVFAP